MAASDPEVRSAYGRLAALTRWAHEDTVTGTAPARKAFLDKFHDEVDPDRVLQPAEREKRAERARKAYFQKLAIKSAEARRHTPKDAA